MDNFPSDNTTPSNITPPIANAMRSAIEAMPTAAQYPDAFSLNSHYRQLEGFTVTGSNTHPLTMTDFYQETAVLANAAPEGNIPECNTKACWTETVMTVIAMLGLLVASSVALGLAARQATIITQQLTHQATQQTLKNVQSPHSWKF